MTLAREILVEARALIAKPECWTKYRTCVVKGDGTKCYCATGAIMEVLNRPVADFTRIGSYDDAYIEVFKALMSTPNFKSANLMWASIPAYNDAYDTTHSDIIAMFDQAIESTS